ncbi:hypothetical protein L209DRAFT_294686 [Thermothelomyces heterothallicus CBS 203.75]
MHPSDAQAPCSFESTVNRDGRATRVTDPISIIMASQPPSSPAATHAPCRLSPPCKQGNHGLHFNARGECVIKEALKHDLAALRKGEVYQQDDFFKRARA